MKKLTIFLLLSLGFYKVLSQSIEFTPGGPTNLKIGNNHTLSSPSTMQNKLLIYNRGNNQAGLSILDSSETGQINSSVLYSKANEGLFLGNLSSTPMVFFNTDKMNKSFFLTPNGNLGIGQNIFGLNNSNKLYGKLNIEGVGDSLLNFQNYGLGKTSVYIKARTSNLTNPLKVGLLSITDGNGDANLGETNIGILGNSSLTDTSKAFGIGVAAISFNKTEGSAKGMESLAQNLGTGSSYGLNSESKSLKGTTYGIFSSASGAYLNYGVYANIATTPASPSPSYGFYSKINNASNQNSVYGIFADVKKTSGNGTAYGTYAGVETLDGVNALAGFFEARASNQPSFGVFSNAVGTNANYGVMGYATGGTENYAIYGTVSEFPDPNDYAGYFRGKVHVNGVLSKSSGTFLIDHPQDPENKTLRHSFVESPEMINIYNGNTVTDQSGTAAVTLPSYFEALNENFKYQLTVIGKFSQAIIFEKIKDNKFKIKTSEPNTEVSWQVTGTRKDAFAKQNPIIVEENKNDTQKGKYLNPEVFGKSAKNTIHSTPNLKQ